MSRTLGDIPAWMFMLITVISHSSFPVIFHLGNADESPFLFAGIRQISVAIAMGALIFSFRGDLRFTRVVRDDIWSSCKTWHMLFAMTGSCSSAVFALGLAFVDVSIAALLYETWPVFLMLLMAALFKGTKRYRPITFGTLLFVAIAIVGVGLVVLSHNDVPHPLRNVGGSLFTARALLGETLVMMSAIFLSAQVAFTLKAGTLLAGRQSPAKTREAGEIVFVMILSCVGMVVSFIVLCSIGLALSETISAHQAFYAIGSGLFVASIGRVAFRLANLKTDDLGVNAIAFATPLVALILLWIFSVLDVPHLDVLIIGGMGIVASNLLINIKASERLAYKALVVSLWVFGTITYFTEGYATNIPLELPVTIFILVLSFRVERLARRTTQEEGWVFDVFRKLRHMASKTTPRSKECKALLLASRTLLEVDHHKSAATLKEAYEDTLGHLEKARRAGIDAGEITEICRMVDKLAHSRQQGSRFGEIVAIALTGLFIVLGLLVFNGEREVYGEIASFVLPSVLVFLFFNIVDLQRDRKDETLVTGRMGRYIVNFGEVKDREMQQYVSMATSAGIVAVFLWLFFTAA